MGRLFCFSGEEAQITETEGVPVPIEVVPMQRSTVGYEYLLKRSLTGSWIVLRGWQKPGESVEVACQNTLQAQLGQSVSIGKAERVRLGGTSEPSTILYVCEVDLLAAMEEMRFFFQYPVPMSKNAQRKIWECLQLLRKKTPRAARK